MSAETYLARMQQNAAVALFEATADADGDRTEALTAVLARVLVVTRRGITRPGPDELDDARVLAEQLEALNQFRDSPER